MDSEVLLCLLGQALCTHSQVSTQSLLPAGATPVQTPFLSCYKMSDKCVKV